MCLTVVSVFLLVVLDQLSKAWAIQVLQPVGSMPFWPGVIQLTYTLNDGAAFSMFAGKQTLLIAVTSVALVAMLGFVLLGRSPNAFCRWGLTLIIGGGLSNLIDRLLNGQVVDYFDVTFTNYAVFNLADSFVTVGCALLFIGILFAERLAARKARKAAGKASAEAKRPDAAPAEAGGAKTALSGGSELPREKRTVYRRGKTPTGGQDHAR